jgi:hypothetical protein
MKIEIPDGWINKMCNMPDALSAKDVIEIVNKSWSSQSKKLLQVYIGEFVFYQIENNQK